MKKLILLITFFVAAIAYSIIWFVLANNIENELMTKSENNISVSGFPLYFNVVIPAGKYNINIPKNHNISTELLVESPKTSQPETSLEVRIDSPLIYNIEVFEQKLRIVFPKNILIKSNNKDTKDTEHTENDEFLFSFRDNKTEISIVSNKKMISYLKDMLFADKKSYSKIIKAFFQDDIRKINYIDNGLYVYKGQNHKIFYSHDKFITKMSKKVEKTNYGSYSFILEYENALVRNEYYRELIKQLPKGISKHDLKVLKWILSEAKKSGSSSGRIDLKYTGYLKLSKNTKPYFDIVIKQIAYRDHLYSINSSGQITMNEEGIFPFGWFTAEISNYKKLINYYTRFYNNIIVPSSTISANSALSKIDIAEIEMYKKLVPRFGTISANEKDITISVSRSKGSKDVLIGNMPLSRLKTLLRKEYNRLEKQLEQDNKK